MKRSLRHLIHYGLALTLVVPLAAVMAACSTTSSPTQTQPSTLPPAGAPTTPPATSLAPALSPTVPTPSSTQGPGASGNLTKIDGNTLTLTTPRGQVTVNVSSNVSIQKTVAATLTDLQTGQFLTVTGAADASGNIAASSIAIRSQGQNPRATPPDGTTPNPSGRSNGSSNGTNPRPTNGASGNGTSRSAGNGAFGTLAKIDGNNLTLTTGQGQQVTVTVGSNTTIQKTVSGTISDLQVGESLNVIGARDANSNIAATSITIRPQAQSAPTPPPGA